MLRRRLVVPALTPLFVYSPPLSAPLNEALHKRCRQSSLLKKCWR